MGKPKRHKKSFNYQKDRTREWKKSKKLPTIHCKQIRSAWDEKKSLFENLKEMGLSANPNTTIHIPQTKELIGPKTEVMEGKKEKQKKKKNSKTYVVAELEAEALAPQEQRLKLSEPEVAFCIAMMDKYGDNYKAMAFDKLNYYQDTPKQIARKIRIFQSIPEQYNAYLASKTNQSTI